MKEALIELSIFIVSKETTTWLLNDELLGNNVASLILYPIVLYRLANRIPCIQFLFF